MADQEAEKNNPREVAWYAACAAAWFDTRLEHDKSLLTLASGGIGLLISLVTAFGIESIEGLILFTLALVAFILCVSAVLWIFKRNSKHIEDMVGQQRKVNDPVLAVLDNVAVSTFLAGVVLSSILGIAVAMHSFESKRTSMSVEKKTTSSVMVGDSVNGMNNMSPGQVDFRRSFNGAANMAPTAQGSGQAQAAQPAQTAGASSPTTTQSNTKAK